MSSKDHVENPTQTPIKDSAIRLAAGGALFRSADCHGIHVCDQDDRDDH
ncbi:MAG: hypothetical protein R3D66_06035 [Alphaproteobacteria bacterium]